MKIYGSPYFGNPRRVAIFLAEKGVEVPFENVDLMGGAHKTPEFIRMNPVAQVPVLELDDGTFLSETIAICRYFEALHPEPPLMGVDPLDVAVVEMWQRRVELGYYAAVRYVIRHTNPQVKALEPEQIQAWGELNKRRAEAAIPALDAQLALHEFLAGERYTVADITLLFSLLGTGAMSGLGIPDDARHLKRWFDAVSNRPSTLATQPPARD